MTRRRWIADRVEGDRAYLVGQKAHHLSRVLRAKTGQQFDVACNGTVRTGHISAIGDDEVIFDLGAEVAAPELRPITLLLAVFKFDRLEWAIEKATELGLATIQPIIAQRTDAHLAASASKRAARWRRIVHEAAQQARRVNEPVVHDPLRLKDALAFAGPRIVLAESEQVMTLPDALSGTGDSPLALAVGPEGGWTPDELKLFADAGWTAASLGPTILRAETAAIAGLAIATAFPQK
jgi:16S rRNA (uracil1498-N3)-methyltransferase